MAEAQRGTAERMKILRGQHWAVIPSRANSTRFRDKALAILCGSTLIERAIDTCMAAEGLTNIVVSTNDKKLAKRLPVLTDIHWRPDEYAQADTRIDDTLIDMVKSFDSVPEFLHLVQLTSPFTNHLHIEVAIHLLNNNKVDSVQLVTPIPNALHAFSQRIVDGGMVHFRYPEERERCFNSQSKPVHYAFAGYVGFRTESLLKYGNIWGERSLPIIASPECYIDIDTPADLEYAEFVMRRKGNAVTEGNESQSENYQQRKESAPCLQG